MARALRSRLSTYIRMRHIAVDEWKDIVACKNIWWAIGMKRRWRIMRERRWEHQKAPVLYIMDEVLTSWPLNGSLAAR